MKYAAVIMTPGELSGSKTKAETKEVQDIRQIIDDCDGNCVVVLLRTEALSELNSRVPALLERLTKACCGVIETDIDQERFHEACLNMY